MRIKSCQWTIYFRLLQIKWGLRRRKSILSRRYLCWWAIWYIYIELILNQTKSKKWLIKFYILFILAKQYSCQPRICSLASDARSVRGNKDSVAWACSMDSNCKAFRHSSKHGIGFLCNPSDNQTDDGYEDWELCTFNR